jgi:diguanylate cyclase (GGDEF)-like protein
MRQLFQRLYLQGTSGASEAQRGRIQFANVVAAKGCLVTLAFACAHFALGHPETAALNVVVGLAYLLYYPLQARGRRDAGIVLVATLYVAHISVLTLMLGRGIGFHLYLMVSVPLALMLFAPEQRLTRATMVASSVVLYVVFETLDLRPWLDVPADWGHRMLALSTVPTIMAGLLLVQGIFLADIRKREASLEQAALTDALTGLPNRRHGFDHAAAAFARARRGGETMALLMLDIDHFKRVNDQHGHAAGDVLLTSVARAMKQRLRQNDMLARWGGEEFLIVVSPTSPDDVRAVAQSLLEHIAALDVQHDGVKLSCTASLGVALLTSQDATLDALLARADRALYEAKAGGRNRVVVDGAPAAPTAMRQARTPAVELV